MKDNGVKRVKLAVVSYLSADFGVYFLKNSNIHAEAAYFDGWQFAKIGKFMRKLLTPILYGTIKSLYKKNGENLGKVMWCDDKEIRPYFIEAGKNLAHSNMRAQLSDNLENKPFPSFLGKALSF